MNKTIALTACLALTLGACADMQTQPAPAKPAATSSGSALDETIASAEKEIAAAKKIGIWVNTEKFLEEAKELKAAGKEDEALKRAKKALKEAQLAQKQAKAEADAKPHFPK